MTGRQFRLAAVLRVRRLQEDAARQRAALADQHAREVAADAQRRAEAVSAAAATLVPADARAFVASREVVLVAAADAREIERSAVAAFAVADAERETLLERSRAVDVLESLEQRHVDVVRLADDRRDQQANDEQALVLWGRRR